MKKRKPVGMAFHWFLPQPFGAEARKSALKPNDLMKWSHKPNQSSPMFVDLMCPKNIEVEFPSDEIEVSDRRAQKTRTVRSILKNKKIAAASMLYTQHVFLLLRPCTYSTILPVDEVF